MQKIDVRADFDSLFEDQKSFAISKLGTKNMLAVKVYMATIASMARNESGWNPRARNPASSAATGLWQFIPGYASKHVVRPRFGAYRGESFKPDRDQLFDIGVQSELLKIWHARTLSRFQGFDAGDMYYGAFKEESDIAAQVSVVHGRGRGIYNQLAAYQWPSYGKPFSKSYLFSTAKYYDKLIRNLSDLKWGDGEPLFAPHDLEPLAITEMQLAAARERYKKFVYG